MHFKDLLVILLLFVIHEIPAESHDLKLFDDSILFNINWHGRDESLTNINEDEELIVTSSNKEKYKCLIPSVTSKESEEEVQYTGPSPIELVSPLFSLSTCSYRIESYWTYEVCHGQYIKQYHEERQEKSIKMQEYFLGRWTNDMTEALKLKLEKAEKEGEKLKYKKIDGLNLPYLEVEMTGGTLCDLNGEPRLTRVLYVCYQHGKNEVYSLKETSTCQYEVVILAPILCSHPKYRPHDSGENKINCVALDSSPKKPKNLLAIEVESMKIRYQKLSDIHRAFAVFKLDGKDGPLKLEIVSPNDLPTLKFDSLKEQKNVLEHERDVTPVDEEHPKQSKPQSPITSPMKEEKHSKDTRPVLDFLHGRNCLMGGTGWWKFEYCHGKYARQVHGDVSVVLGFFNEDKHKEWLKTKPEERSKLRTTHQIVNFYSGGDFCDLSQAPRQVEVRLKCVEKPSSPSAVALYLNEPKPCEYVLHVESSMICELIPHADENMIIPRGAAEDETSQTLYLIGKNVND